MSLYTTFIVGAVPGASACGRGPALARHSSAVLVVVANAASSSFLFFRACPESAPNINAHPLLVDICVPLPNSAVSCDSYIIQRYCGNKDARTSLVLPNCPVMS